ncbi:MAG: hypothetical protein HN793_01300 [Rhodospirillaceae bacterium]|nr:hypothetical protein [Rhodospirillaceae bacterium]
MRMWRNNGRHITRVIILLASWALLSACEASLGPGFTKPDPRNGVGGIIVADEPQAVIIAQKILSNGGSAADAAVALGFGLSVTLQSSAGLGGGGLCLVYDASRDRADTLDFMPVPAIGRKATAKWHVAIPALTRGLYALHAEHGKLPWQQVVVPAENLVRSGNIVSRALARDLSRSAIALANDPKALDVFMSSQRTIAIEGDRIDQLDLAFTLGQIRGKTPSDFYVGGLAQSIDLGAKGAGASLSSRDLLAYDPRWDPAESEQIGSTEYYRAVAFEGYGTTAERADADLRVGIESARDASNNSATTGFIVADADRNVVACSLTMLSPFGIGVMPTGLGFLLAPSPSEIMHLVPPLIVAIAVDHDARDVQYAAAAGGAGVTTQVDASVRRVVFGQTDLAGSFASQTEDGEETKVGQINAMYCQRGIGAGLERCAVRPDPKGHGFGTITVRDR